MNFTSTCKFFLALTFGLLFCGPNSSIAAPMPMTTTSQFFQAEKELFYSKLGFTLHAADTSWVQAPVMKSNKFIQVVYQPTNDSNVHAALTVRADNAGDAKNLDQYVQKWLRDYPRFGIEILSSKKVRVGDHLAHMLDLINKENRKQLRQILIMRGKNVLSFTCRDDAKNFSKTVRACNDIIRTYR